jgi:hypothetical protein
VTDKGPLGSAEERVSLNIRSSSSRSQTSVLVLDKKFPDQGLAETREELVFIHN